MLNLSHRTDLGIGDVAFASRGESTVLFSRGNLVLLIRNARNPAVRVTEAARQIDRFLIARPTGAGGVKAVRRVALTVATSADSAAVLPLEEPEPGLPLLGGVPPGAVKARAAVWYKVFCTHGELEAQEGGLICRPNRPGEAEITVLTVGPSQDRITARFSTKPENA